MQEKILIVDDELLIRESMRVDLEEAEYTVDCAEDGEEALALLKSNTYNLLISDLVMEKVGGIELLARIREQNNSIPVILITGHAELDTAIEGLRLGASDYLQKPYNRTEFLIRIKNCLEKESLEKKVTFYEKILPICALCKKVRKDSTEGLSEEDWENMEDYLKRNTGLDVSHGICPECNHKLYGDQDWYRNSRNN